MQKSAKLYILAGSEFPEAARDDAAMRPRRRSTGSPARPLYEFTKHNLNYYRGYTGLQERITTQKSRHLYSCRVYIGLQKWNELKQWLSTATSHQNRKTSRQDSKTTRRNSRTTGQDSRTTRQDSRTIRQDSRTSREDSRTAREGQQDTKQDSRTTRQGSRTTRQDSRTTRQDSRTSREDSRTSRQDSRTSRQNRSLEPLESLF